MIITNLIAVVVVYIWQIYNNRTMTKTLRFKDIFMYLRLIDNEYVYTTVKPYKMKILKYNRIFLLITTLVAPFFIWLNNSTIILVIYIFAFLIIPFIFNQYLIAKNIKEFKSLKIDHQEQPYDVKGLGLFFSDTNKPIIEKYGVSRFLLNYNNAKGKALIVSIFIAIIVILASLIIFIKPVDSNAIKIEADLTETALVIKYEETEVQLDVKDINSVEKINELPNIVSKVEGIQENGYTIGIYNLQGFDKANVFTRNDSSIFIHIKTAKGDYFYSESDTKRIETIYNELTKQLTSK